MTKQAWWQAPRLRTDEDEDRERRVGWLELFFDLVFVVVVAELSHSLGTHVSWAGLGGFVLLFLPVWWVWIGGTFYNERFEANDVSTRLFVLLQMLPVAVLAIFAHDGMGAGGAGFALAYAAARVILIVMWLRAGWHAFAFRPVSSRYATGFALSVALFVASAFVPPPARYGLWIAGLFIDLLTPMTTLSRQRRLPRLSTSRLPERFGLFTIIVLGESIVGGVRGVAETGLFTFPIAFNGALGIALAFAVWWVYFDFIARRPARGGVWWTLSWGYLHLPLVMAITAVGAGVLNAVAYEGAVLPDNLRLLLAGAVAAALMTVAAIELTLRPDPAAAERLRWSAPLKLLTGMLAAGITVLGAGLSPALLLLLLLALVTVHAVYGAYLWYTYIVNTPVAEGEQA